MTALRVVLMLIIILIPSIALIIFSLLYHVIYLTDFLLIRKFIVWEWNHIQKHVCQRKHDRAGSRCLLASFLATCMHTCTVSKEVVWLALGYIYTWQGSVVASSWLQRGFVYTTMS